MSIGIAHLSRGQSQYWCFIPRPCNETMLNNFNCLGEPRERPSEMDHLVRNGVIEDRRLVHYLERVPLPPTGFMFSYQDRQQQRFFFDVCSPLVRITFPSSHWIYTKWPSLLFVSERVSVVSVSHRLSSARWSIIALAIHYWNIVHRSRRNQTYYDLSCRKRCWTHLWPSVPSFLVSRSRSSSKCQM